MMAKVRFVWGRGGVGKSHLVLREAYQAKDSPLIISLDPSQRLLHLVGKSQMAPDGDRFKILDCEIELKILQADLLFEQLAARAPTSPRLKHFYQVMVRGLQDFREYLLLIQLSDEIERSKAKTLIVDTPPFQEATGLHRKALLLRNFFGGQLVQFTLKSNTLHLLSSPLKKVFETARLFVGKEATSQVFELIEWLMQHTDRFQQAATHLESLFFSENSEHVLVLTPETPSSFLDEAKSFFKEARHLRFCLNRSLCGFPQLENPQDPFLKELSGLNSKEILLISKIQSQFLNATIDQIPWQAMGEDNPQELETFVTS